MVAEHDLFDIDPRAHLAHLFATADEIIAANIDVMPAAVWVKPDGTIGKAPLLAHGHLGAHQDAQLIRQQLVAPPHVPPGVPGGFEVVVAALPGSGGFVLLDCDVKGGKQGQQALNDLVAQHGNFVTAAWRTPSGGVNVLLRKPARALYGNRSPWPGIDVRADGGWVVAPESTCAGGTWIWVVGGWGTASEIPGPMAALLSAPTLTGPQATKAATRKFIDASPTESSLPAMQRFAAELRDFQATAAGSRHDALVHIVSWAFGMNALDLRDAMTRIKATWLALTVGEREREDEVDIVARWVVGRETTKRATAPPPPGRSTSISGTIVHTADQLNMRPAPQLVRGWFPLGELSVVGGKAGVGKGIVLADIVARGSRGDEMPNGDRILGWFSSAIITLPGEDTIDEWARRLNVAAARLDRVLLVEKIKDDEGQTRSVGASTVLAVVTDLATRGARLIVLDSLTGLANSDGRDTNKGEVRALLDALSEAARRHDIAVVVIHHVRKADGDPLDSLSGSAQIGAAARAVLVAVEERVADGAEPDVKLFGVAKLNGSKRSRPVGYRTVGKPIPHHDGKPMRDDRGDIAYVPLVQWIDDRTFTQGELIAASNGTVLRAMDREQAAADILANGPMPSTVYVKEMGDAGYSGDQARRARERVGKTLRVDDQWWTYPTAMGPAAAKQAILALGEDEPEPESEGAP
jgi:hypothetical protein